MPALSASRPLLLALLLLAFASGCDLFSLDEPEERTVSSRIAVASSGVFGAANTASITFFNPGDQTTSDVALDGFLNSTTGSGQFLFAAHSPASGGHVSVVDLGTSSVVDQIDSVSVQYPDSTAREALGAVRYLDVQSGATYLTSFAAGGSLRQVSFGQAESVGGVAIPTATPYPADLEVVAAGATGKVFVADYGASGAGTTLTVVDVGNTEPRTVELGCDGPTNLFQDADGELAVVCTGTTVYDDNFNVVDQTDGQVVFVDPEAEAVTDRITLSMPLGSANATQTGYYDPTTGDLFAIATGSSQVVRVDTRTNALETTLPVPDQASLTGLTAVAYDGRDERLYLGRLPVGSTGGPDYSAEGSVVVLDAQGTQVDAFVAGVSPAHIAVLAVVE